MRLSRPSLVVCLGRRRLRTLTVSEVLTPPFRNFVFREFCVFRLHVNNSFSADHHSPLFSRDGRSGLLFFSSRRIFSSYLELVQMSLFPSLFRGC